MTVAETILKDCEQELSNMQHLHSKFDASKADWRPQENMRTTLELLQYLSFIGSVFASHFPKPSDDRDAARNAYRDKAKWAKENVTFANFPQMIDKEREEIRAAFANISDADLQKQTYHMFSGAEHTVLEGLLTVLRYLCAYRHQLFVYAKLNGAEVNTRNNWYGLDPAPKAA
jgi:hypothetical protein